ncbi:unnamed protein product, partial [Phaeothamnion confervicola]
GGPLNGWVLGLALWSANWGLQLFTAKVALGVTPTAAVGMSGISFISRAWLVAGFLFVVALKYDETIGLVAAGVIRRLWPAVLGLGLAALLVLPAIAAAAEEEKFDPSQEFSTNPYIELKLGPLDMSINKAVIYLFLASAICIGLGYVVRGGLKMRPTKAQNVVELAYEFAEQQIARPTLSKSVFNRYFPYIATLFLFIAVSNLISFIPLPVSDEGGTFGSLPDFGLYAATANINVTLALTLITFIVYNYEGVRAHGPLGYIKTLIPDAPGAIKP